jgi:Reverse transcriptase (RNA-dependent DNA polymerase)
LVNDPVFGVPIPSPSRPLPVPDNLNPFLRCSERIRQPVFRPDNVYGNQPPVDILAEDDDDDNSLWPRDQSPSPSGTPSKPSKSAGLTRMVQDGGAGLINFLLRAAVSLADAKGKIPEVSKAHEWHYRDPMRLPKAMQEKWKIACKEELEALCQRNVFKLTDLPKGRKTIGCRWVFNIKSDSRKKARLVAQGFSQVEGIDFNELFSPIVHFESVQLILALSALEDYYYAGVDVRNAYLYGKLDEEIYMRQPEGFKVRGQENKVIRLQHALYGLKQAGLAWWKELNSSMNELGFKCLMSDAGLFVCKDFKEIIIAIVYVDNAMFGKNKAQVDFKKKLFMDKWECCDLGEVKEFLRMRITQKRKDIHLDQHDYLDKVLERFSMTNAKSAPTPLPSNWVPQLNKGKASPELLRQYQSIIGLLLYLMIGTRPDIAFAVTKLAQFSANPS